VLFRLLSKLNQSRGRSCRTRASSVVVRPTKADVSAGNAVFVASQDAVGEAIISRPIAITIPQYAYFNDDGRKLPVVVVQAEEARGKQLVGARDLDGKPIVGFITDFELLGNVSPKAR